MQLSPSKIVFLSFAVGPGGSPDENGETTIDALVMDGVNNYLCFIPTDISLLFVLVRI